MITSYASKLYSGFYAAIRADCCAMLFDVVGGLTFRARLGQGLGVKYQVGCNFSKSADM